MPVSTRRQLISGLGALAASALVGCSSGDDVAAPTTPTPTPTPTNPPTTPPTTTATTTPATAVPPTTVPPATTAAPATTTATTLPAIPRHPLTGVILTDPSEVDTRPALIVKIDNAPVARANHSGLANADIVFEEIVEGEITRFAAVFHTQGSDPVGPIRSGRSQDVDMLSSFNRPLFAWSGGNAGVTRLIYASDLVSISHGQQGNAYYRGPGRAPNNLFSSTDRLWALALFGHVGPPSQQFEYLLPDETFAGQPVSEVDVKMGGVDVTWEWSPEFGVFVRWQGGSPHNDKVNGRIAAANVVMPVVRYQPSQVDARSPEAQTIGNGPVYVISDGKQIAGRWSRETNLSPFVLTLADGSPIKLRPGKTWVELVRAVRSFDEANPFADITFR